MQTTFALAALAAVAFAAPHPQGVTEDISPKEPAPEGCAASYSGNFQIGAVKVVAKRDVEKRQSTCGQSGSLTLSLIDGKLTDGEKRTGYIADNRQFQFDAPAQTGAIYTDGFSACNNGSLALGGSAVFYRCLSGEFYNLYDQSWAPQCEPVELQILPCSGSGSAGNGVGQQTDGQPTNTGAAAVTQIADGQPQGPSALPVISQISDGQIQAPTVMPVSQISDGQPQAPNQTASPVTQINDGQVQAPAGSVAPVTEISDGQPQAPAGTPAPISQITDGQIQAPTGTAAPAPITQISDGQPQAPTASPVAPITQISDGQPQAPTASPVAPITQIGDGQIQAPANGTATTTPVPFDNAGSKLGLASSFAGLMALAAVLL